MSGLSAAGEGGEPEEATVDGAASQQQQPKKPTRAQKRRVGGFSVFGFLIQFVVLLSFVLLLLLFWYQGQLQWCWAYTAYIIAVISVGLYLKDKGEHTALYLMNKMYHVFLYLYNT